MSSFLVLISFSLLLAGHLASAQTVRCSSQQRTVNRVQEVAPGICQITPETICDYFEDASSACICDVTTSTVATIDTLINEPNYTCSAQSRSRLDVQTYEMSNFQGNLRPPQTGTIGGLLEAEAAVGFQFPGDGSGTPLAAFQITFIAIVVNNYEATDTEHFLMTVEADVGGQPSGTPLLNMTLSQGTGQSEQIVTIIPQAKVCLPAGDTYFAVLKQISGGTSIAMNWFFVTPPLAPTGTLTYVDSVQKSQGAWFPSTGQDFSIWVVGESCCPSQC